LRSAAIDLGISLLLLFAALAVLSVSLRLAWDEVPPPPASGNDAFSDISADEASFTSR
jgi:hypothetical protein